MQVRVGVGQLAAASGGNGLGDVFRMAIDEELRHESAEVKKLLAEAVEAKKKEKEQTEVAKAEVKPKPKPQAEFAPQTVDLGNQNFNLQVQLTNKGGGVQRVIVTHFPHADEEGKRDPNRNSLHLVCAPDDRYPDERDVYVDRYKADEVEKKEKLRSAAHEEALPSFLLYHYHQPNDLRPESELGERAWTLMPNPTTGDAEHQEASFTTDLTEFGLRLTKTYTLDKGDYHVGLSVKVEKIKGATVLPFRYSLSSGHALPIEGRWYTSTYRNAYFGWRDGDGGAQRHPDDAASIQMNAGGEKVVRTGGMMFQYAAVANQYFASALCVDDQQDNRNFIEFGRATAVGSYPADKYMLGDITARLITEEFKPADDKPVEHKYILYHGPVKVRLLHRLSGDEAVRDDLVDRYENCAEPQDDDRLPLRFRPRTHR